MEGENVISNHERRRFVRVPVDVRVRMFAGGDNGMRKSCYGRGHDISLGGMAIYVPYELKGGQEVGLEFELPHSRMRFGVRCVVRNSEGYRYGVEFLQLGKNELAELKQALERAALLHNLSPANPPAISQ